MKKWIYIGVSSVLAFFSGIGFSVLMVTPQIKSSAAWRIVYGRGMMIGGILFLVMLLLGYLILGSSKEEENSIHSGDSSFKQLLEDMKSTIVKARESEDVRHSFMDYLKSMWVDESAKPFVERALKEIIEEFPQESWLFAIYGELLMSDGRWTDAEVMIKRAWEVSPTDEYVRQVVKQWIEARSEKDPFRVSEMVRRLREVYPEGWLYLLEAEHMMKIGRRGHIEEVLLEAYKMSTDDMALFEIMSAYLGYLASEGRDVQMFSFFERLKQVGSKPVLYAIEAKLSILVGDYERAIQAFNHLKEEGASSELIDAVLSDIMSSARKDSRDDIIEKLFE